MIKFYAYRLSNDSNAVFWEDVPKDCSISRVDSENVESLILSNLSSKGSFEDKFDKPLRNQMLQNNHYVLKISDSAVLTAYITGVADMYASQSAILRKNLLSRNIGQECFLFRSSDSGDDCPECYDSVRRIRIKTKCSTCDGSGTLKGFTIPVKIMVAFDANNRSAENFPDGKFSLAISQAWTSNSPIIEEGDFVLKKNERIFYRVSKQVPTVKRGWMTSQQLSLTQMQPNSWLEKIYNYISTET